MKTQGMVECFEEFFWLKLCHECFYYGIETQKLFSGCFMKKARFFEFFEYKMKMMSAYLSILRENEACLIKAYVGCLFFFL